MPTFYDMGNVDSTDQREAEERSEKLLESLLTPTQLLDWHKFGYFTEHTTLGDFSYVYGNFAFLYLGRFYCVEPQKSDLSSSMGVWFPLHDKIVTQLLLIRADPELFMQRAASFAVPRVAEWNGDIE